MRILYEKHLSERKPPQNLKVEDRPLFERELSRELPEAHLLTLKNAWVLHDLIADSGKLSRYLAYTHVYPLSGKSLLKRQLLRFLPPAGHLQKGVWIIDNWSMNYFHWFTDALSRLLAFKETGEKAPVVLPKTYQELSFVRDSLRMLEQEVYFYEPSRKLGLDTLYLPSHTAPRGNYNASLIRSLKARFESSGVAKRRVYISRASADRRKVANEEALKPILDKHGFEIHQFEHYTFEEQVRLMQETSVLLGLHGAGFTNMLFMPEGGKIIEIRNRKDAQNNCYFTLASELGHDYYYLLAEPDKPQDPHWADVVVHTESLRELLERIT